MDSFLEQFYAAVTVELGDPHLSRRLTDAQKLIDLGPVEKIIWEELLQVTGQESAIGRAEATITLENGKSFYPLPGNFRQFVSFQYWTDGDRKYVENQLPSIPLHDPGPGVEILSSQRGMMIRPEPQLSADQDWTLTYLKGPVILHHATAGLVANLPNDQSLAGYTVSTTKITKADTFTKAMIGETVACYDAAGDALGSREITDATADYIEFAAVTGLDDTGSITIDADWCWLVAGTPGTDAGTLVKVGDYYNGSLLRVYDATVGAPQTMEILDYYHDPTLTTEWHFKLEHAFLPLPTGTALYEIRPALPQDYDRLYAVDVALKHLIGRVSLARRKALLTERRRMMRACRNYFTSNVSDRMPARTLPVDFYADDPYD